MCNGLNKASTKKNRKIGTRTALVTALFNESIFSINDKKRYNIKNKNNFRKNAFVRNNNSIQSGETLKRNLLKTMIPKSRVSELAKIDSVIYKICIQIKIILL